MFSILLGRQAFSLSSFRYEIGPKHVSSPEGFEDFVFGNGPVKEGVVRKGEAVEPEEEGGEEDGGA